MKNHFYMPYYGNKRNECEEIYGRIEKYITNDTVVIEPYCGSCAVSYYIWLKYPNLKFILNDSDKFLFDMFNLMRDKKETKKLNKWYNELMEKEISKEEYKNIIKEDNIYAKFLKRKFYARVHGLYPARNGKTTFTKQYITKCGIYEFFNKANIEYKCMDAVEVIKQEKDNKNNIIFIDPPYINTCNEQYNYMQGGNIYEYCYKNNINDYKCSLFAILEQNWMISLLFKDNIDYSYGKKYGTSQKKTTHFIISNRGIDYNPAK